MSENPKGFFELKTAADLLVKAEADFVAMERAPGDSWLAFNFFVTVEHIPDWVDRRGDVKGDPILRVVSQLAAGAKHFAPQAGRHRSIAETERERVYEEGVYEEDVFYEPLVVWFTADEEKTLGTPKLDVVELGERALAYWRRALEPTRGG